MYMNIQRLYFTAVALVMMSVLFACVSKEQAGNEEKTQVVETQDQVDVLQRNQFAPKSLWGEMSHEDSLFVAEISNSPWEDVEVLGTIGDFKVISQSRDWNNKTGKWMQIPRVLEYPQWRLVTMKGHQVVDSCYLGGLYGLPATISNDKIVITVDGDKYEYDVTDMPRYIDKYANKYPDDFTCDSASIHTEYGGYYAFLFIHPTENSDWSLKLFTELLRDIAYLSDDIQVRSIEDLIQDFVYRNEDSDEEYVVTIVPVWRSSDKRFETYRIEVYDMGYAAGPKELFKVYYYTIDNVWKEWFGSDRVLNETALKKYVQTHKKELESVNITTQLLLFPWDVDAINDTENYDGFSNEKIPVALMNYGLILWDDYFFFYSIPVDQARNLVKEDIKDIWNKRE